MFWRIFRSSTQNPRSSLDRTGDGRCKTGPRSARSQIASRWCCDKFSPDKFIWTTSVQLKLHFTVNQWTDFLAKSWNICQQLVTVSWNRCRSRRAHPLQRMIFSPRSFFFCCTQIRHCSSQISPSSVAYLSPKISAGKFFTIFLTQTYFGFGEKF